MQAAEPAVESPAPSVVSGSGVELSGDPAFARRIIRLAFTSLIALGAIFLLARFTTDAKPAIQASLASGWVLMPAILFLSLPVPAMRYALVIPSALVAVPLLLITTAAFSGSAGAALGWLLISAGVLLGGLLGVWFWFRWAPVPGWLDDPFSRGRWIFIGVHVSLIVSGLILVCVSALA